MNRRVSNNQNKVVTRPHTPLSCIQLERRQMLSGSVMATLLGNSLVLFGDENDNEIELSAAGDDLILSGVADTMIQHEGTESESVRLVGAAEHLGNFFADMRGGDDQIVIRPGLRFSGNFVTHMGWGNDALGLDTAAVDGNFVVLPGSGGDTVSVRDTEIGGRSVIMAASGDDTFSAVNSLFARGFVFAGNQGNDVVNIERSEFGSSVFVFSNSGQDDISIENATIQKDLFVFSGRGDDLIVVSSTSARFAFLFLGTGSDTSTVSDDSSIDALFVFGGLSEDSVTTGSGSFVFSVENSANPTLINDRLRQAGGFQQRVQFALDVFLPPDGTPALSLILDDPLSRFVVTGGLLLTDEAVFVVSGTTAANSVVEVDRDGDGLFNDGQTISDSLGRFVVTTDLLAGENTVNYRVTDRFRRTDSEALDVHLAIGTVVQFATSLGNFSVELFDDDAPLTTMNFLKYQAAGLYDETIIHRSELGVRGAFLIQGGGYKLEGSTVSEIAKFAPVQNEFNPANSNLRGTLAMAHPESQPNGGTSEWFINLNNANEVLDDVQLTVFGRIIGNGLNVADSINSLDNSQIGPALGLPGFGEFETPLLDYTEFTVDLGGVVHATSGTKTLTGIGTSFQQDLVVGQQIRIGGTARVVDQIISDTELEVRNNFPANVQDGTVSVNSIPTARQYVVVTGVSVLVFD